MLSGEVKDYKKISEGVERSRDNGENVPSIKEGYFGYLGESQPTQ